LEIHRQNHRIIVGNLSDQNKFVQPNDCDYICNQVIANNHSNMRRDPFHSIAVPARRAILSLIALQAMTPNALAEHSDSSRQAISKHIKIPCECNLLKQEYSGREIYNHFNTKK
jgi:DNA-binding transcriptional ArsR family regulator